MANSFLADTDRWKSDLAGIDFKNKSDTLTLPYNLTSYMYHNGQYGVDSKSVLYQEMAIVL